MQINNLLKGNAIFRQYSPKVQALIKKAEVTCLLNISININVIKKGIALQLGLAVQSLPSKLRKQNITIANKNTIKLLGVYLQVLVKISSVVIQTYILVVNGLAQNCVLEKPYIYYAFFNIKHIPSKRIIYIISNKNGRNTITFKAFLGIRKLVALKQALYSYANNNSKNKGVKTQQAQSLLFVQQLVRA